MTVWLLTKCPNLLAELKHKRRQIAKQLIPQHLQTNYHFWTDRKKFYSQTFSKKGDERTTRIKTKEGKVLEGKAVVDAIQQVM